MMSKYVDALMYRYSILTNVVELEPKLLNFRQFIEKDNDKYICNLSSLMHFTVIYKYFVSLFEYEEYFVKGKFKVVKIEESEVKKKLEVNLKTFVDSYFSDYKAKMLYKVENNLRRLIIPFEFRESYLYKKWFLGDCSMNEIFDIYMEESNYQNAVLKHFFPNTYETILDISMDYYSNVKNIFELNEKELNFIKEFKISYESKKPKPLYLKKTILFNSFVISIVDLWFESKCNYYHWKHRYVIPFQAFTRYYNTIFKLLKDSIHNEPFIVQSSIFKYNVVYKGNFYTSDDDDIFKVLDKWMQLFKEHNKGTIKYLSKHDAKESIFYYYPWINIWYRMSKNMVKVFKKKGVKEDKDTSFYGSLSRDIITIEELLYCEKEEEEKIVVKKNGNNKKFVTDEEIDKIIGK